MSTTITLARTQVYDAVKNITPTLAAVEVFDHVPRPGNTSTPTVVAVVLTALRPNFYNFEVQAYIDENVPDVEEAQGILDEVIELLDQGLEAASLGPSDWSVSRVAEIGVWFATCGLEVARTDR
jgi:hypothetical protein